MATNRNIYWRLFLLWVAIAILLACGRLRFESKEFDYEEVIINQFINYSGKPVFSMEAATGHPLQALPT